MSVAELITAALVFLRIAGILFFLPIFGDAPTPVNVRILISLLLAFSFFHLLPIQIVPDAAYDVWSVGLLVVRETLIGFSLGLVTRFAFDGAVMAATLVGFQMGFGMANMFVPDANEHMTSFTALHRIVVMSFFFALDLHHIFINAIAESFQIIPLGTASLSASLAHTIMSISAGLFVTALQLAAPILVALLFAMAALGLAARAVPQLNVFVMSFPVSFFLGLIVYVACFPFFPEWLKERFFETNSSVMGVLYAMKP